MKLVPLFVVMASISAILVGCGEPATNAPEDDAFQKQLADAAAKNKDPNLGKRGGGAAPPTDSKMGGGAPAPGDGAATKPATTGG